MAGTIDGWEVVTAQEPQWEATCEEAYNQIFTTNMEACQVCVGDKEALFCLKPKTALPEEARRCAEEITGRCRTCMDRIPKFAQLIGKGGKNFAFCKAFAPGCGGKHLDELRRLRASVQGAISRSTDFELIIIDEAFKAKYPVSVGPFTHVHLTCEKLTSNAVSDQLQQLSAYFNGSFENRFQRLVDDPSSLGVIQNELPNLVRPGHWQGVVSWAVGFVAKANGVAWSDLAAHEKYEIMVYAMLTGRSSGSVHLDMQQASNLVDFMDDANDTAALRAMMDDRSDPAKYQVSRVAELLQQKKVTSLCTVTLVWGLDEAPHRSDLDLHTKVGGKELYYGCKSVGQCILDFDANAGSVEKNPAENISLNQPGTFHFRVNNYNNRDKRDVPFQVIVRKPGFHEVFEGTWPSKRRNGDFLEVCTVTITSEDLVEKPVELSEAERKKLAHKEAEWQEVFGDVKSKLATDQDMKVLLVHSHCAKAEGSFVPPPRGAAQEVFSQLLAGQPTPSKKKTLAERCQFEKLSGLIKYVSENKCILQVNPRNFAPAYLTRIDTKTEVLANKFPINAFHRKNELPQQPRSDEQSTARFDSSWFGKMKAGAVDVHGFVQINNVWFMILRGAKLPQSSADWPLGGGMYPTQLKPEIHHHRSKWASFHSLVAPLPPDDAGATALIGSALVGFSKYQFILDGREITVRSE
eukprot:TRINITY_DN422_c0_g1_i2.p1 TRINITY_DN422_c0_g1~~TRINITY_DN422_c0_g1_i2.p1  ORF type:complete len:692 (-),score=143.67 TRINITY_DN422_c0_g1_i2:236-2311(-)